MARIDEIMEVCKKHNLILIEDSAQALGATYKGKAIGTFGKIGCFSFDFFKIITCGEGGAIITDEKEYWDMAHQYSDHGHDHIGTNRGAEQHPILGTNYRISELNAAIGLAQVRKLDSILERQRANKKVFEEVLGSIEGVTFRDIPDNEGDSSTFFSFFLPTEELTRAAMKAFADAGIAGTQYWYDNNFHYIKNWQHLKDLKTIAPLAVNHLGMPQDLNTLQLPKSDEVISRLISVQIRVGLSTDETREYLMGIKSVLEGVL
jgi:8-amino-3,8-dideoxy-alpha-D-manno-octulosonate transaminase